jgi:hypothetical protein
MKRAFTTCRPQLCTFVAGLAISAVLVELTPLAQSALASEIGTNDFRISDMGPDGDANFDAGIGFWSETAVAYNANADEYLVVWTGDDGSGAQLDDEFEIYGQRLDALTGAEVGPNDFRISNMGPDGDANFGGLIPAVAYNPNADEYLVVWYGDDDTGSLVDGEVEIYGQRLDALTGAEVGPNDFRISDMGSDGDADIDGGLAAVAYNANADEYLVVWIGDDDSAGLADDEYEIHGQRLDASTGAEVGPNDFRISDMGPDGNANLKAIAPALAYNSNADEYLVVWHGNDAIDGDFQIFGQRLDGSTGAEIGINDFRISDGIFQASFAAVAYNPGADEYLVVWNSGGPGPGPEWEIYGQRLDGSTGAEVGCDDLRISDMGPDGNTNFLAADKPAVAYNLSADEYLVVWNGDDETGSLVDGEFEIYGQRLDGSTGLEIGSNDFRISDMGPDGDTTFDARRPALPANPRPDEYLVIWEGDDDTGTLVDDEDEIFGQLLLVPDQQLPTADSDYFMSYRARRDREGPAFYRFGPLRLSDQFGSADYEILKQAQLLLPADKDAEGVFDEVTHLEEYRIKTTRGTPRFASVRNARIRNRFGDYLLEVKKPTSLMVPTNKDLIGPVEAPDPGDHMVDHFLCYQAKHQRKLDNGTRLPRFAKGAQVLIEDQFQTRRYDLKKITKLCSPVAKDESPSAPSTILAGPNKGAPFAIQPAAIDNPDRHLVCYQAKLASKAIPQNGCGCDTTVDAMCRGTKIDPRQARHLKRGGIHTNNQFGPELLDTVREVEVCVPSLMSSAEPL